MNYLDCTSTEPHADIESRILVADSRRSADTDLEILGSQLTAEKLADLAVIPAIFVVQTIVSYSCVFVVSQCLRLKKRTSNFVAAMAVSAKDDLDEASFSVERSVDNPDCCRSS
ncbi:uncharacterized protein BO72DRAFT_532958 [Aspergillus fijiensis CBS 313.89]|uniref:Uncharacterized protein n=1 Tax=Aspergillus fijiensis CBS 313.89 TaxID=1448319 RepID=A0A8G1VVN3_9EURO|nr:uncharacterized protein BO72DRAFT_532958 [Aspergillus fijiensis CBS 313.89]RAK71149.1 hypothetical protein BO72DRAFT_532958 [Aspergillus fijiensis CBS 313.89]